MKREENNPHVPITYLQFVASHDGVLSHEKALVSHQLYFESDPEYIHSNETFWYLSLKDIHPEKHTHDALIAFKEISDALM